MRTAYKAENDKYWEEEKVFRDWYKEERRRKCGPSAVPCCQLHNQVATATTAYDQLTILLAQQAPACTALHRHNVWTARAASQSLPMF